MGEQKIKQAGGEIGRNIRRVRLELGMGQTELVRRLQLDGVPMTRETLVKIERGVRHIELAELRGIRSALNTSCDEHLKWNARPKPRRLKVFCPAFLQKSGRGPGAAPLAARRSARNAPCAKAAQEGVKGGNPRRGFPLRGRPGRPRKSNENAARTGGVFTISRVVTRARKIPRHAARFPPAL